jgi:hypothetical protein
MTKPIEVILAEKPQARPRVHTYATVAALHARPTKIDVGDRLPCELTANRGSKP